MSEPTHDPALNEHEARIAELATGFALNELDDGQLHELHGYLADPLRGRDAARTAWSTLHTVTDLRAEQSHALQDTVRSRIESQRATGVTGRLMLRLGLRRGGLTPVMEPTEAYAPHATRRWLFIAGLSLITVAATWFLLTRAQPFAHLEDVVGRAAIAGHAVGPGDALDGQPLGVAEGARATVRWPDGTRLILTGPGTVIPQSAGAAVLGGQAQVTTAGTWAIGLPDSRARANAGARLVIEVEAGRSCVSIFAGLFVDAANQPLLIHTCRIGSVDIPWTTTTWTQIPDTLPLPAAARWNLTMTTLPAATGSLTLSWADGSLVNGPEGVALLRGDGTTVRAVRPPADRRIELEAKPWGFTVSLQYEILLQTSVPPAAIRSRTSGHVPLNAVFRSGPPLLTD